MGPQRARASRSIQPYGAATTRPDSQHYTDQMRLFVEHQLKPVWFDPAELRQHVERAYRPVRGIRKALTLTRYTPADLSGDLAAWLRDIHDRPWRPASPIDGTLADPTRAIIGPGRDAVLLWGAPLIAFIAVQLWVRGFAALAPEPIAQGAVYALVAGVGVLTFAHLIAVVPRAYLNPDVFAAYRTRLTVVPVVLIAALLISPTALSWRGIVAVLWDVHHSAMQNFGFARLYDLKAGNPPTMLRATDLRLNWVMYVGPLLGGCRAARAFRPFPAARRHRARRADQRAGRAIGAADDRSATSRSSPMPRCWCGP